MVYFLLIIGLLLFPVLIHAQTSDSITKTTWFWPLLSICLALLLSIPCTLITVLIFCYNKKHSDDSDELSISSNSSVSSSSSSSTRAQRRTIHHHHSRPHRLHYAGGFRSPPPPYTTSEQPENLFSSSSLPPPYEPHLTENNSRSIITNVPTTIINVEPIDSTENQSSINPRLGTTFDVSSTLTSPSIQTFQV